MLAKQLSSKVGGRGGNTLQGIPLVRCQGFSGLCKRCLLMSAPKFADGLPAQAQQSYQLASLLTCSHPLVEDQHAVKLKFASLSSADAALHMVQSAQGAHSRRLYNH